MSLSSCAQPAPAGTLEHLAAAILATNTASYDDQNVANIVNAFTREDRGDAMCCCMPASPALPVLRPPSWHSRGGILPHHLRLPCLLGFSISGTYLGFSISGTYLLALYLRFVRGLRCKILRFGSGMRGIWSDVCGCLARLQLAVTKRIFLLSAYSQRRPSRPMCENTGEIRLHRAPDRHLAHSGAVIARGCKLTTDSVFAGDEPAEVDAPESMRRRRQQQQQQQQRVLAHMAAGDHRQHAVEPTEISRI